MNILALCSILTLRDYLLLIELIITIYLRIITNTSSYISEVTHGNNGPNTKISPETYITQLLKLTLMMPIISLY